MERKTGNVESNSGKTATIPPVVVLKNSTIGDYKILSDESPDNLAEKILRHLKDGYELKEQLLIHSSKLCQVVVKYII